jgi:hypothetical protein
MSNRTSRCYYIPLFLKKWIKLCNEELHNFYSSPDIARMIKDRRGGPRKMHGGNEKLHFRSGNLTGKGHSEDLRADRY